MIRSEEVTRNEDDALFRIGESLPCADEWLLHDVYFRFNGSEFRNFPPNDLLVGPGLSEPDEWWVYGLTEALFFFAAPMWQLDNAWW